jgi:hypothetical protein
MHKQFQLQVWSSYNSVVVLGEFWSCYWKHGPSKKGLLFRVDLVSGHEENTYLLLPRF